MKTNALSVANYFIDLAQKEGTPIHLLGLVKRVYIAHGFALALLGRGLLDPRFDKVEAWKYGPVIPSVYHSFKQYKRENITTPTVMLYQDDNGDYDFKTPEIKNEQDKLIVEMVWKRYHDYSDNSLVDLTHMDGTPWKVCYKEGENKEIPDSFTELYYQKLVNIIVANVSLQ